MSLAWPALCTLQQSASSLTSQDGGGVSEAGRGPVPPLALDVHLQELPRRVLSLQAKYSFIQTDSLHIENQSCDFFPSSKISLPW